MTQKPAILVVDDEDQILRVLRPTLEAQGYSVTTATTGAEGLRAMQEQTFAVVILDLGLPDMDGKDVIREARSGASVVPIIVLSARDQDAEKILALDYGAEDYLAKPFSVGELLARVRVALRASRPSAGRTSYTALGVEFDFRRRIATLPRGPVSLSARETQFLRLLVERRGDVVTHREIIMAVWGDLDRADAQFVRVLAGQVRHKIEDNPSQPRIVLTVPGMGYQFGGDPAQGEAPAAAAPPDAT